MTIIANQRTMWNSLRPHCLEASHISIMLRNLFNCSKTNMVLPQHHGRHSDFAYYQNPATKDNSHGAGVVNTQNDSQMFDEMPIPKMDAITENEQLKSRKSSKEFAFLEEFTMKRGLESGRVLKDDMPDSSVANTENYSQVFDEMRTVNMNAIAEKEELQCRIRSHEFALVDLLKEFAMTRDLECGRVLHSFVIKCGYMGKKYTDSALISMYAKCGELENARILLEKGGSKNSVLWNAMLVGYAQNGHGKEALNILKNMHKIGLSLTGVTLSSSLSCICDFELGQQMHAICLKMGSHDDVFVAGALVGMYAKCHKMDMASLCFSKIKDKDLGLWTTLASGYVQNGKGDEAMKTIFEMKSDIKKWSRATWITALSACACSRELIQGFQLHSHIIKCGMETDTKVMNSLIHIYSECKDLGNAYRVFGLMPKYNVVTWNAMISGFAKNDHYDDSLQLFVKLCRSGLKPGHDTFSSMFNTCASFAAMTFGSSIHGLVVKVGYDLEIIVANSIVYMYSKCGNIGEAYRMFRSISPKDALSWNTMISALSFHGRNWEAIRLFKLMECTSIRLSHVTFLCVLSACSHIGSVDEGLYYFDIMREKYKIEPIKEHYACMVDLLARAGRLGEALRFFVRIPLNNDAVIWRALLWGCRAYGCMDLGRFAAEQVIELDPNDHATCVLLCNMYNENGRSRDAEKLINLMKKRESRKESGCSWIEVKGRVHLFL